MLKETKTIAWSGDSHEALKTYFESLKQMFGKEINHDEKDNLK